MRPQGRGELESLYFDYPRFDTARVPEPSGETVTHQAIIVGAGPVGLTAAIALARYGIKSVILEARNTFNDGSRAICVARSSMQTFQQIGVVQPFLDKALGWTRGRCFYSSREIYAFDMPYSNNDKFYPMYNIQQQYIERYLWEIADQCDLIDIRWGSRMTQLRQSDSAVIVHVESDCGAYDLQSQYLLAADGAHSAARKIMKLRLQGQNFEGRYVIADVRAQIDRPTERLAMFEPKSGVGATVLVHRQPDNIWRIDWQLRDGENEEEAIHENNIRGSVAKVLDELGHCGEWDLEWWSIYTANTLCLDDYRHGRIFFIGDSAHIVPIFGVRGLNNGITDAHNLSWKLAYVLNGLAGETLLDTYSLERRGATLDVFANASKSARFMTPPTRGWQLARHAVLSLAVDNEFTRPFANPRQMHPFAYVDRYAEFTPVRESEFSAGTPYGHMCSNAQGSDRTYLLDFAGQGFSGILFATDRRDPISAAIAQACGALDPEFKLVLVTDSAGAASNNIIPDHGGKIASAFGAKSGSFYLLRPDLHVAGRWRDAVLGEIESALRFQLVRPIS
ncbi:MAG: FAD-dependent monooxygenase [Betaproteobacteria bacterium]|nr:FAD-dependent monooxygenase [Betaproteobacteria bacterium]